MASRYHPEMTAQLLNLHFEKQTQAFSGALNGYPVYMMWYPGDLVYSIRIFAKHPQDDRCQAQLDAFQQMHTGFHFLYLRAGVLPASYILRGGIGAARNLPHFADGRAVLLSGMRGAVQTGYTERECSRAGAPSFRRRYGNRTSDHGGVSVSAALCAGCRSDRKRTRCCGAGRGRVAARHCDDP